MGTGCETVKRLSKEHVCMVRVHGQPQVWGLPEVGLGRGGQRGKEWGQP